MMGYKLAMPYTKYEQLSPFKLCFCFDFIHRDGNYKVQVASTNRLLRGKMNVKEKCATERETKKCILICNVGIWH